MRGAKMAKLLQAISTAIMATLFVYMFIVGLLTEHRYFMIPAAFGLLFMWGVFQIWLLVKK